MSWTDFWKNHPKWSKNGRIIQKSNVLEFLTEISDGRDSMTWDFISYLPDVGGHGHQKNGQLSLTYSTRQRDNGQRVFEESGQNSDTGQWKESATYQIRRNHCKLFISPFLTGHQLI